MMRFKVTKRKSSESRISYPCSKTSWNITFSGQPVKRQIHYSPWMRRLRWQRAQKLWNEKHQDGHLSSTKPRFLKSSPYHIFTSQCMIIHHQRVPLPLWILFLLTSKSIIWGLHKLLTCWKCGLCIIAVIILQYQLALALTWARYWVSVPPVPPQLLHKGHHQPHMWVLSSAFCRRGIWVSKR